MKHTDGAPIPDGMKEMTAINIKENIIHNRNLLISAAEKVRNRDHWINGETAEAERVRKLKFCPQWCINATKLFSLKYSKVSRNVTVLPDETTVRKAMQKGQDLYVQKGHTYETTINMDETAVFWENGATHVWKPVAQDRGCSSGASQSKGRITAILAVNAAGIQLPCMGILRHSKSSKQAPDQTKMRVVSDLLKINGFSEADGWYLKTWSTTLVDTDDEEHAREVVHKVKYLYHQDSKTVITSL